MTVHLYNPKDVAKVRKELLVKQGRADALTGLVLLEEKAVLDHNHDTQFVRAVVDRQVNAALGKLENVWRRYLSTWYPYSLSHFLRQCADYIEKKDNQNYVHPAWLKKVMTEFKKLPETKKTKLLHTYGLCGPFSNSKQRLAAFRKLLLSREVEFNAVSNMIETLR